ncbi:hypothetical protein [Prosthecobacter sp.]|uniref:hypothetical protein n=1 Tax=Prosthecobacter sp. TaxID=1965333 RepID=UPI002ABB40A4|nr:hypothetical protein [Prosthecobacter sp.]MDZ4401627.1 hypothetical protein [Prosthecobacter sp.]
MKTFFLSITILFIALVLLLPWRSNPIGAYPENLWTARGQWSKRADPSRLFRGTRTEYGLVFPWLVHDQDIGQEAWYVRLDQRILVLHLFIASALSAGVACYFKRRFHER